MRYTYDNSAGQRAQPAAAAGPRALGPALRRGDGRPVAAGAAARRRAISSALSRDFRAEGRRRGRQGLRGRDREASRRRRRCTTMWRCCISSWGRATARSRTSQASLALKPQSAAAHYNLGTALTVARRLDEAAARVPRRRCGSIPATPTRTTTSATCCWRRSKYDEAIREFAEVVRLQPESEAARKNLAAARALARETLGTHESSADYADFADCDPLHTVARAR